MSRDLQEGRHWSPESLAALHNAKENAWFIALGHLPAGRYRATLGMNGQMEGIAQFVSAGFEIADFPLQCADKGQIAFFLVVDRSSVHYLRLKSSKAQTLSSLGIQSAD